MIANPDRHTIRWDSITRRMIDALLEMMRDGHAGPQEPRAVIPLEARSRGISSGMRMCPVPNAVPGIVGGMGCQACGGMIDDS